MAKTCIRCGHERRPTDTAPDYACPACGVVYAKAEAAHAQEEASRARVAAMAAIAAARAPASQPAQPDAPANPRAEALIRQMMAERAGARRGPSPHRGMALAVLVAFSVGFAAAAGMYSGAAKLAKANVNAGAAAAAAADCNR